MAEFTADRAGLLTCQDLKVATKTLIKMAGLPEKYFNDAVVEDFIIQAQEFHDYSYDNLDKLVKLFSNLKNSHPWIVVRGAEMLKWANSGQYDAILNRSQNLSRTITMR
jgi:Zn-dependent protease with chaperone function